jgi:hypothetical protein
MTMTTLPITETEARVLARLLSNAISDTIVEQTAEVAGALLDRIGALDFADAPAPTPTTRRYTVTGTVHMAGGFDVTVEACDPWEAREKARAQLETMEPAEILVACGVELQEVCPDGADEVESL